MVLWELRISIAFCIKPSGYSEAGLALAPIQSERTQAPMFIAKQRLESMNKEKSAEQLDIARPPAKPVASA